MPEKLNPLLTYGLLGVISYLAVIFEISAQYYKTHSFVAILPFFIAFMLLLKKRKNKNEHT